MGAERLRISPGFIPLSEVRKSPEVMYFGPQVPLPEVPLPNERVESEQPELEKTGVHELKHAYVAAEYYHVPVVSVSVKRDGNSLGRTTFAGHIHPEAFKVIAASGGAPGDGMDMYMINLMRLRYGGASREEAKAKSEAILSGCDPQVLERAAKLLIHIGGEVQGSRLYDLLARAKFEVALENGKQPPPLESDNINKLRENGKLTIREYFGNEQYKITYVAGGVKEKEITFCGLCQGTDGHKPNCSTIKTRNRGIIFSANPHKLVA